MATMHDSAPAQTVGFVERRRTPRLEVLPDQIHGQVSAAPITIRDIGFGGFSGVTSTPFRPGAVHDFRLTTEDGPSAVVRARAIYCRAQASGSYVTGFEFVADQPHITWPTIDDIMDRLTAVLSWDDA
jgi:hypothetical protein